MSIRAKRDMSCSVDRDGWSGSCRKHKGMTGGADSNMGSPLPSHGTFLGLKKMTPHTTALGTQTALANVHCMGIRSKVSF